MIVSRNIPVLPYIFLAVVISLPAFKFYLDMNIHVDIFELDDDTTPYDFSPTFLLHPELDDKVPTTPPSLLILVTTKADETLIRQQIRKSWANISWAEQATVNVEFFMGRPTNSQMPHLLREMDNYNDLVVTNLTESYYGLAAKTVSMLSYKKKFYPKTKCLVKADSDNVLIIHNYVRLCEETAGPLILGKCDVSRIVKRNTTKWAVPTNVWPPPTFPSYCSTGTYMLVGRNLANRLLDEASLSKFSTSSNFRKLSEDVLVTGILAERAGIRRRHVSGLSFFEIPEFVCRNSYKHTYSIHLRRDKNPAKHYFKLMQIEGQLCKWWDLFAVRRPN